MRQIGTLENADDALLFVDFLLTVDIRARVDNGGNAFQIWVIDEEHVRRGAEELAAFAQNPGDPRFADVRRIAAKLRADVVRLEREYSRNVIDARGIWGRRYSKTPVAIALLVVSVAVSVLTKFGAEREGLTTDLSIASRDADEQGDDWGLRDIRHGQAWRLATPMFLHLSPMHLFANMLFLMTFGALVESRRGSARFCLLALTAAVLSNLGQYWHAGPWFGGMSGVLYAIFGYALVYTLLAPEFGIRLSQANILLMVVWTIACLTLIHNVANMAHAVGMIVGVVAAGFDLHFRRRPRR